MGLKTNTGQEAPTARWLPPSEESDEAEAAVASGVGIRPCQLPSVPAEWTSHACPLAPTKQMTEHGELCVMLPPNRLNASTPSLPAEKAAATKAHHASLQPFTKCIFWVDIYQSAPAPSEDGRWSFNCWLYWHVIYINVSRGKCRVQEFGEITQL